jgi:hypothetical protein
MGDVYKYGYCNIAATGANDVLEGCYFDREHLIVKPLMVDIAWKLHEKLWGPGRYCLSRQFDEWAGGVGGAPLNEHAWVLQERVLSPRTIYFGSNQIFWECCCGYASETWPVGPQRFTKSAALKVRHARLSKDILEMELSLRATHLLFNTLHYWRLVVELYSGTRLTLETDRPIALSGIAQSVQAAIESEYLAGLWNQKLVYQLYGNYLYKRKGPDMQDT